MPAAATMQKTQAGEGDVAPPLAFRVAAPQEAARKPARLGLVEEAAAKAPKVDPDAPVAVVVMHGMGQQVPFETLEDVAEALQAADERASGQRPAEVTARTVLLGSEKAQRVELRLSTPKGPREVHLYEAYWAPITEGAIDLRGVMAFLWRAGTDGFVRSHRTFWRWMFGRPVSLQTSPLTRLSLLLALLVMGALVAFNALVAAVGAAYVALGGNGWPSPGLLVDLSALMGALLLLLGILAVPAFRTRSLVRRSVALHQDAAVAKGDEAKRLRGASERLRRAASRWSGIGMGAVLLGFLALLSVAVALPLLLWLHHGGGSLLQLPAWLAGRRVLGLDAAFAVFLPLWALLAVASLKARGFIVQFVGDVAVYVSAQRLDAYAEKRKAIKETACRLAHAVYACRAKGQDGADGDTFAYSRVAVVGHSLGSVVAYDTLNRLLDDDGLTGGASKVQERTALLLTFGSPLDKTAFIFGIWGSGTGKVREKAATSVQPLIQSDARRAGLPWLNVHAPADIISGPLDYYDDPKWPEGDAKRVRNVADPHALTPLMAHNEYWKAPLAWDELRKRLV